MFVLVFFSGLWERKGEEEGGPLRRPKGADLLCLSPPSCFASTLPACSSSLGLSLLPAAGGNNNKSWPLAYVYMDIPPSDEYHLPHSPSFLIVYARTSSHTHRHTGHTQVEKRDCKWTDRLVAKEAEKIQQRPS